MYPLRFQPIFRRYLWGGRRLQTLLGKPIGDGQDYAESWEIADHGEDQTVVADGALAGQPLGRLVERYGPELFGSHPACRPFPLLLKFLDAHKNLSVQVHPNDEQAARLDPPDLGKTEAWVVLHADPGSRIYAGLKPQCDRQMLEEHVRQGTTQQCLHQLRPQAGDCVFIPAGTVHALGAGLVVAEIQQSSDTTFRLFDWNRLGPDGKPRPLHVEQALEVIDYERGPVEPQQPEPTDQPHVERLVHCDKFVMDRWQLKRPAPLGGDDRFHIVAVLDGAVDVPGDAAGRPLGKGDTMLVPAACGRLDLAPRPQATLLEVHLP